MTQNQLKSVTYAPDIEAILGKPTATVDELARVISCGRNQAYDMVRSGQVRSIRVGRAFKVPTAAIRQLLEGGAPEVRDTPRSRSASF